MIFQKNGFDLDLYIVESFCQNIGPSGIAFALGSVAQSLQ